MKAFDDAAGLEPDLKDLWGETVSTLIGPVESHVQTLTAAGRVTGRPSDRDDPGARRPHRPLPARRVLGARPRRRRRAAAVLLPDLEADAAARLRPGARRLGRDDRPGPQPNSGTGVAYSISK